MSSSAVTILYFAALRERVGRASQNVTLAGETTVGALLDTLRAEDSRLEAAFSGPAPIRVAVNKTLQDLSAVVRPGDELAFFPPMTGG